MPALPLDDAGPYVAAAYLVFLALILVYVAIMATKLGRIEREIGELSELVERREPGSCGRGALPRRRARVSELLLLGTSHKTAPLAVRERVALPEGRAEAFLRELADASGDPRGGRALDLQPDRAVRRRQRPGRGGDDACSACSPARPGCGRPS